MTRKDIFSKKRRSEIMSSIRSKNTKIERQLSEELEKQGLKFERHAELPGTPDFFFPEGRLAVFCHGDFWHGLNYKLMKPKLNAYWRNKIENNMKRDIKVVKKLNRMGWKVLTLKGSDISKDIKRCIEVIKQRLTSNINRADKRKNLEWFCMRYHKKIGCAEIARRYKVTRQAVNQTVIREAYKAIAYRSERKTCPVCNKGVKLRKEAIKTNKYDKWKKYTRGEINYITRNFREKNPKQLAKHLKRTAPGIASKIRRLKLSK